MRLSAQEIATAVGGELTGDGSLSIEGAAGLDEASESDLSFFHNVKYIESLQKTKARIVLVPQASNGAPAPAGKTLIRVKNPQWAFAQVLGVIEKSRARHPQGV